MSTNYAEEASFGDEEILTVADGELSTAVGGEKVSGTDAETAGTHRTSKPIAQDERAIVEEEIRPGESGRVRFQSSWWPARSDREITFKPGDAVRVIAIDNITLIVEG